uniref:G_PROTEIN_RECEP_F1_2 domain-containing protein n=1 Tax=Schistosoma mansoni TaxID=6183 RepID=A0A3Q0KKH4_SCHMA
MIPLIHIGENLLPFILFIQFYGIIITYGKIETLNTIISQNHHHVNLSSIYTTHNTTHNENLQNKSLILDQSILNSKNDHHSINHEQWYFHFDMFIIMFLAFSSFCTNIGLLYLDRCAKSSIPTNNSSFSNHFITITNTTNNNTTSSNNLNTNLLMHNNINNLQCLSFNYLLKKWSNKRNSYGFNSLLSNQSSIVTIPNETINKTTKSTTTTTRSFSLSNPPLNKYPSSISLIKLNQTNQFYHHHHHGSIQYHTPRGRRQRRYLRGLFGLSISNLSLSLCLLSWCICQMIIYNIDKHKYYILNVWLTIIAFINLWTIDIAQTLEIGAILWIALERTLGIHWPSEIQTLNSNNNNNNSTGNKTTCHHGNNIIINTSIKSNPPQYKFKFFKNIIKKYFNSDDVICNQFKMKKNQSFINSNKKINHEKYKIFLWFLRVLLCLLPFILFILASLYSLNNIIQYIKKHKLLLYNNQYNLIDINIEQLPWQQEQQPQQQPQQQMDMISNFETTYIIHNNSSINDSYIKYFNSLIVYNYYYYTYITNHNNFIKKHISLLHNIHMKYQIYMYYTSSIIPALIIGQFIAPLMILITTNLLIYQKVASRDKRFFSRQSSNTSKSSFISGTSISSVNSPTKRKLTTTTINFPIPLLRVLESSNQDIRMNFDDDHMNTTNNTTNNTSKEHHTLIHKPLNDQLDTNHSISNIQEQKQNTLLVPFIDLNENSFQYSSIKNLSNTTNTTHSLLHNHNNSSIDNKQKYLFNERRNSISVIQPTISSYNEYYENHSNVTLISKTLLTTTTTTTNTTNNDTTINNTIHTSRRTTSTETSSSTMYTIQKRRKSTNDLFNSLFQSRTQDLIQTRSSDESILIQALRRQHRRTLRILIILLLIFVICRGPRSIILIIEWLQYESNLYTWLQYTSIFSYTSAILDTIIYGFWGNRAYRLYMKNLCHQCALYKYCIRQ